MKKSTKIALIVGGILAVGGLIWAIAASSSNKSGVEEKDSRNITFTKD